MFFRSSNLGKSIVITISSIIVLALLLACVSITFQQPTLAASKNGTFYAQLDNSAQKFYDALQDMYSKGSLKTGTMEYDLIDKDVVTAEQARKYAEGDSSLLYSLEAAKDAFMMEHNVFYVDFSKLQLSVGIKDNKYVVTLGSGRNNNYYTEGFTSESEVETAITAYNTKLQGIVNEAKTGETVTQKIVIANFEILRNTTFGYGINSDGNITDKASQITTSYGALCNGTAVYEGFARLFRDVLTEMDMENVLVKGYILNENESFVPAMWNYVKINNAWYAIDAGLNSQSTRQQEYLLVGQNQMKFKHYTSEIISNNTFEFDYPELSTEYYGYVADVEVNCSFTSTMTLNASYLGKNAANLAKNQQFLAFRISEDGFSTTPKSWGNWVAMYAVADKTTGDYANMITNKENETTFAVPGSAAYVQIAVISSAPSNDIGTYISVDDDEIISISAEIANEKHEGFVSAPTAKKVVPSNAEVLDADKTYTIVFVYDEYLTKSVASEPVDIIISSSRGAVASPATNVFWDSTQNADTVSFTFTASPLYNDNYQTYYFEIKNLIGSKSKKSPNKVSIDFQKFNINLSNNTQNLCETNYLAMSKLNNLDLTGWTYKTPTGTIQSATNLVANQLNLVSSTLNPNSTQTILDKIVATQNFAASDILVSTGYDIALNLCGGEVAFMNGKMIKLETKMATANTTYKAFVCQKNSDGTLDLDKITQLNCYQAGNELIIETNKFGSIVLLAMNPSSVVTKDRTILVKNINGNGTITAKINGVIKTDIISLKLDESVILEFTPNIDYKFVSCQLNGKLLTVEDNKAIISFNDTYANNILDVCFVASRVANYEATVGLNNLQSEYLNHQFAEAGTNVGLWVCVGICCLAMLVLLIVWIAVVARNKKREKIARELGI